MMDRDILIIGDDIVFSKSLKLKVEESSAYKVEVFNNFRDGIKSVSQNTDFIILDATNFNDSISDTILEIKQNNNFSVVVISGEENSERIKNSIKNTDYHHILKDDNTSEKLIELISKTPENNTNKSKHDIIEKYNLNKLIGDSQQIRKVYESIEKIINTNINVSLHGEPGTGKEMIAKVIHYNSNRKHNTFISIDLRAIKYEARDVELLGVDRSVRNDKNNQVGLLERANGGTIFLEGFEEIDDSFQFYLQKILQNKEILRVGGIEPIPLDVRIITSYNQNIEDLITQKKINELQYYRTMGAPIEIPPLRERGSDIVILAEKFISDFVRSNKMKPVVLSDEAKDKLLKHTYSGNVQELKAIIELATVMCSDNLITADDIKLPKAKEITDFLQHEKTLKDYTRGIIRHFLDKYENNVLLVAEKLDVGKSTIYRMIKNNEI